MLRERRARRLLNILIKTVTLLTFSRFGFVLLGISDASLEPAAVIRRDTKTGSPSDLKLDREELREVTLKEQEQDLVFVNSCTVNTTEVPTCRAAIARTKVVPHLCRCAYRRSIVKISRGYIDSDSTNEAGPGQIFDRTRTFPVHPLIWKLKGGVPKPIQRFPVLANGLLSVYGNQFGHFSTEILPGIIYFLRCLPPAVPILIDMRGPGKIWAQLLEESGIVESERWIHWRPNTTYFANELFFQVVEQRDNTASEFEGLNDWQLMKEEYPCSWRPSLMNDLVRDAFLPRTPRCVKPLIIVLHRKEGKARRAVNQHALMRALNQALPTHMIKEFVGAEYKLQDAITVLQEAQVFIAPHGAGLAFMQFLPRGAAVIEIGLENAPWPMGYYEGNSLSLGLKYFYGKATGKFDGPIIVDVNGVVSITLRATRETRGLLKCADES